MPITESDTAHLTSRVRRRLAAQLAKAQRHYGTAFASYARYAERPGTVTGQKDHARYALHHDAAEGLMAEILAQLHGEPPPDGAA